MKVKSVEFEPCVMPLEDKNWKFALGTFVDIARLDRPHHVRRGSHRLRLFEFLAAYGFDLRVAAA